MDAVQKVMSFPNQILQKIVPKIHLPRRISLTKPGIITVVVTSRSAIASDMRMKFVG